MRLAGLRVGEEFTLPMRLCSFSFCCIFHPGTRLTFLKFLLNQTLKPHKLSCIDGAINVYVCGYKRVGWVILLPTEGEQIDQA